MSIHLSLMMAEAAVAYVKQVLPDGASDDMSDLAQSWMYRNASLRPTSVITNRQRVDNINRQQILTNQISEMELWRAYAQEAISTGQGNCMEQGVIAFDYLARHYSIARLALVLMGDDHIRVIIEPPYHYSTHSRHWEHRSFPIAWPPEAVICDSWGHEWFVVSEDWSRKMRMPGQETYVRVEVIATRP